MGDLAAKYERPIDATLVVRLATGDEWEATDDDLPNFGLLRGYQAEAGISDCLRELGLDPDRGDAGAFRWLLQTHVAGREVDSMDGAWECARNVLTDPEAAP